MKNLSTVNGDHTDDTTLPVSDWGFLWLIQIQLCSYRGVQARAKAVVHSLKWCLVHLELLVWVCELECEECWQIISGPLVMHFKL